MTERELKCMSQTILSLWPAGAYRIDALALVEEVRRLRQVLRDMQSMAGSPVIIRTIEQALEQS